MNRMMHIIAAGIALSAAVVNAESVTSMPIERSAYAQYGSPDLLAHFDAIENVGAGKHESSPSTWTDLMGNLTLTKVGSAGFTDDAWVADGSSCFTATSAAVKSAIQRGAFTVEMVISHPSTQNKYENWIYIGTSEKRLLMLDLRSPNSANPLVQGLQYRFTKWLAGAAVPNYSGKRTKWGIREYVAVVCSGNTATAYYDGSNFLFSAGSDKNTLDSNAIGIGGMATGEVPLYSGSEICSVRMTTRALSAAELNRNCYVDSQRFGLTLYPAGYTNINSVVYVRLTQGVSTFEFSTDGGATWADDAWAQIDTEVTLCARRKGFPSLSVEFSDLPSGASVDGNFVTLTPKEPCDILVTSPNPPLIIIIQ